MNNPHLPLRIETTKKSRIKELETEPIPFGKIFSDHMLVANYSQGNWQDVQIIPYGPIDLSPATSALHYGQAIFEGMKAYKNPNGEPLLFRPDANHKRINQSAERLCMPAIPESIFIDGLKELIKLDADWIPNKNGSVLYIRPIYFAVDESVGLKPSDSYKFIIITCPVGAYYSHPVKLIVTEKYVRAFEGGTGAAKVAGNYAASLLADREAKEKGYDNVIWLDGIHRQYIEECGTMNLAFVIDGVVVTPKLTGTILAGITRDSVLTLCRDWGMPVEERAIAIDEIVQAYHQGTLTEAFGMGTAATIAHISTIGYQGEDMILPPVSDRKVANQVFQKLEEIKTGRTEDIHNWICRP
ncbi:MULTISPECIES: branched-chain amino acid aminotransferase [Arthrospira]|uniref:branched-chain-amino-acid transaminase n=1 Tax=Limnospira platensis NIES-46 TaxID=1236695 RepID=A0A5M3TBA8_LIMPL|nr:MULTISPECIES: branched-chain amino acid aminotransferase [Arthrospira]AMW28345.1 branched-chain amino acid aminotransferase [Arthrospira platensis YZ]KDR58795.1 branched-chain amino acid aminotransferase [Arthrospira platensis str. Paraca]MBD2671076.1 branched-chain amino acid aminotransferase [Arthrospira platensis FACHB-439]MBD2712103.1 branched-chain amino acid aminotransferase [Arthrospira platensis FACHB-835]MDF2209521.1 branched-chain amino acid aminotransferase [Arthrospira platensis